MKKYIGLLILGISLSYPVFADWTDANCTNRGGHIITGVNNNMKFCRSKVAMNWWTAHAWCKAHGGQLADAQNVCPAVPLSGSEQSCPNINVQELDQFANGQGKSWLKNILSSDGQIKIAAVHRGARESWLQWHSLSILGHALCE